MSWTKAEPAPARLLVCPSCKVSYGTLVRLGAKGSALIHEKCRLAYMRQRVREAEEARAS